MSSNDEFSNIETSNEDTHMQNQKDFLDIDASEKHATEFANEYDEPQSDQNENEGHRQNGNHSNENSNDMNESRSISRVRQPFKPQTEEDKAKNLFVGGLNWETTKEHLVEYFSKYGKVDEVNIKIDPVTGRSRGFGFITFESKESVDKVLATSEHIINGKCIDPKPAKYKGSMPVKKIFVGGLDPSLPESELREYFSKFGKIEEVELPFDKQKNQRRAFCFLSFETEEAVNEIVKRQKHTLGGKECDVKKATPQNNQAQPNAFMQQKFGGAPYQNWNQKGTPGYQAGYYQNGAYGNSAVQQNANGYYNNGSYNYQQGYEAPANGSYAYDPAYQGSTYDYSQNYPYEYPPGESAGFTSYDQNYYYPNEQYQQFAGGANGTYGEYAYPAQAAPQPSPSSSSSYTKKESSSSSSGHGSSSHHGKSSSKRSSHQSQGYHPYHR